MPVNLLNPKGFDAGELVQETALTDGHLVPVYQTASARQKLAPRAVMRDGLAPKVGETVLPDATAGFDLYLGAGGVLSQDRPVIYATRPPFNAPSSGDATAAIQAAIDAAEAAGGGLVFVDIHEVTATLNLKANVTLQGVGPDSKLIPPAGFAFDVIEIDGVTASVRNLRIEKAAGAAAVSGTSVAIRGDADRCVLEDVTATDMQHGFNVSGGEGATPGTVTRVSLTRCRANNSNIYGFRFQECDGVDLTDCQSVVSGLDGAKLEKLTKNVTITGGYYTGATGGDGLDAFAGGDSFTIQGGVYSGNSLGGIVIKSGGLNKDQPLVYGYVRQATVTGVRCDNNGGSGLSIHRNEGSSGDDPTMPLPVAVTVSGGTYNNNGSRGIYVRAHAVTLQGVTCRKNQLDGILVAAESLDVSIIGPNVAGNGQTAANTRDGIRVIGDRVVIVGGTSIGSAPDLVRDDADLAAATKFQRYGVRIESGANDCRVFGITAVHNVSGDISDVQGSTIIRHDGAWTVRNRIYQAGLGDSTFFGFEAGRDDDGTTNANTFLGHHSGRVNIVGVRNVGVGTFSLLASTANDNTGVGHFALGSNTGGIRNTAVGSSALLSNAAGSLNVGIGYGALQLATSSNNVAVGAQALDALTSAGNCTGVGWGALSTATGGNNIALGYLSGDNVTTGTTNIIIGYDVDAPVPTGNNQLTIGNIIFATGVNGTGVTVSTGKVGIREPTPDYTFDVNGPIGWKPGVSVAPVDIGHVVVEATNDTTLTFKLKGSDSVVRSATLTLA